MSNSKPPDTLYRYRPTGAGLGRLLNELSGTLFCAYAEVLNDPFDGLRKDQAELTHYPLKPGSASGPPIIKRSGVACFSETWRSAPMWAHYSASYTGVCLGYSTAALQMQIDAKHAHPNGPNFQHKLMRVDYLDSFPDKFDSVAAALKSKSRDWEYEKEWRRISEGFVPFMDGKPIDQKGTGFHIDPRLSPRVITEIMIGHRIDNSERHVLFDLWRADKSLNVYTVWPAKDGSGLERSRTSNETSGREEKVRPNV